MQSDVLLPWRLWQRSAIRVSDGLEGLVFSVNETWAPWTDVLLPTVSNQAPAFSDYLLCAHLLSSHLDSTSISFQVRVIDVAADLLYESTILNRKSFSFGSVVFCSCMYAPW
jgi:hypothetical protein